MISIGVGRDSGRQPLAVFGTVSDVRASWRAIGGCWELDLTLTGPNLAARADAWLGSDLYHDGWNWFGRIVTIDLTRGWLTTRYDLLDEYANRVALVDEEGIEWAEDAQQVTRYGRWEVVIQNNNVASTAASDLVARELAKRVGSIPYATGIASEYASQHTMNIKAMGRLPLAARIANNITNEGSRIGIDITTLADTQISTIIADLIDNHSGGDLTAQAIANNSTALEEQDQLTATNTWALLEQLAAWDDFESYRLDVDRNGNVRYYPSPDSAEEPSYDIYTDRIHRRGAGAVEPYQCRPGWYRDMASGATLFANEIGVRDGAVVPDLVRPTRTAVGLASGTGGGVGGTSTSGSTSGGGLVAHDINGSYHTGFPLKWSNVDAAAGDLEDLGVRAHSSLQSIQPDDHHAPVTAGDGIDVTGQEVAVDASALAGDGLAATPSNNLQVDASALAGDALQDDGSNNLAVVASELAGNGLTELGNNIQIGTPGTLSNATSNGTTSTSHTHAITASSNPGGASSLLESDSNGYLQLERMGLGRAPAFPIHVDSAGQQLRLDYSLGSHFGVIVGNGGATTLQASGLNANLTLDVGGNVIVDPDGKQVDPFTNYDVNLGALNKKYLSLHAAELWVETLVAQNTIATIGGRILVGPTTKLTSDLSSGSSTIEVEHNEMASGDRVYMEADGKVEFMAVTSSPSGSGPYTYTVTRNLEGAPAPNEWYAGDAVFNTGTTGDGFIDLYSVAAVNGAGTVLGPAITGNVRNSSTYNDWSEHWSIGNLRGNYGYSSDTYGAAFGKYAASSPWVAVDASNGFRVMYGTTPEQLAQWDTSGNILIGKQASGESNVYITSSEVQLRTNTTPSIRLKTDGTVFIGENANSAATISHAVFASTQFYNNESMGAGDFLLGQNSASTANIKWDASAGQFSLRDGTTDLVTLDTDGITIDSVNGGGIPAAYDGSHAVTWRDGTRYDAGISGGGYEFASVHQESYLALNVDEVKSGSESYLYLRNTRVDGSIMATSADRLWFTNEYARAYLYQKHLATSPSYTADSFSAGTYTVDVNTSFGVPDEAVAVEVFVRGQWNTASPGSGGSQHRVQLRHGTSSFTTVGEILAPGSSKRDSTTALVELDSLGRFQFVVANGTVDQFWIIVTGYYI